MTMGLGPRDPDTSIYVLKFPLVIPVLFVVDL